MPVAWIHCTGVTQYHYRYYVRWWLIHWSAAWRLQLLHAASTSLTRTGTPPSRPTRWLIKPPAQCFRDNLNKRAAILIMNSFAAALSGELQKNPSHNLLPSCLKPVFYIILRNMNVHLLIFTNKLFNLIVIYSKYLSEMQSYSRSSVSADTFAILQNCNVFVCF